ncbi:MAG: hydrogenase [Pseudomonadota bacterium]
MGAIELLLGKAGFVIFTLGLAIGAVIPHFRNSRMGLSAHTTAVQTGTALIAFGLFWPHLEIASWAAMPLAISLIASFAILIVGLVLAASFGASETLPIAGKGFSSTKAKERTVSILTLGSSVSMLLTCVAVCFFFLFP